MPKVTDAMVEAGVKVLHASGLVDRPTSIDGLVVREMLEAALSSSRCVAEVRLPAGARISRRKNDNGGDDIFVFL